MVRREAPERTLCVGCSQAQSCVRAGHDGCFCHFVPRAFDKSAAELLDLPSAEPHNRLAVVRSNARVVSRAVCRANLSELRCAALQASDLLVETSVVSAKGVGSVIMLINWQMQPASALTITVERRALHGCAQTC